MGRVLALVVAARQIVLTGHPLPQKGHGVAVHGRQSVGHVRVRGAQRQAFDVANGEAATFAVRVRHLFGHHHGGRVGPLAYVHSDGHDALYSVHVSTSSL